MSNVFKIHILGASAAIPTSSRFTTSQLVMFHNRYFLLDCCEGVQIQLRRLHLPMMKIDHILISHLHGDHYLGLPGLIFTMHLLGRKKKLHVYAPEGMREIIDLQYKISKLIPGFNISWHLIKRGKQLLFEDALVTIETIKMEHGIETYGFLIKEKQVPSNIRKEAIDQYQIPVTEMHNIKAGKDFILPSGEVIPNHAITSPAPAPRTYAYCSDTGYTEDYIDQISHADLLYHEATFLHDKVDIAREKTHCTALQAAQIAQKASVRQLMLGHFSARYDELAQFIDEARSVFENTILAEEGATIVLGLHENYNYPLEKQP
jgi:ribonuclease Z